MRISDWSSDVCSSDLWKLVHQPNARLRCSDHYADRVHGNCDVWQWPLGRRRTPMRIKAEPGTDAMHATRRFQAVDAPRAIPDIVRKRAPRSEEHTSELQSLMRISYAVFCLKKKKKIINTQKHT